MIAKDGKVSQILPRLEGNPKFKEELTGKVEKLISRRTAQLANPITGDREREGD